METINNSQENDRVFVYPPPCFSTFLAEKKNAYRGKKKEQMWLRARICLACQKPCSESLALEKKRKKKKKTEKKSRKEDDWEMFIVEEINIQHFDVFPQILSLGLNTVLWLESWF